MTDTSKRLNQESLQRNLMNNDFRTFMDQQRGLRLQQDSELADMRVRLRALEERLNQREAGSLGTRCRSASRWLRRHLCCCFHWTARGERIAIVDGYFNDNDQQYHQLDVYNASHNDGGNGSALVHSNSVRSPYPSGKPADAAADANAALAVTDDDLRTPLSLKSYDGPRFDVRSAPGTDARSSPSVSMLSSTPPVAQFSS